MKIISRKVDCSREETLLRACQRHPNVVKLIDDVHHDRLHTYIVMELLTGGELSQRPRPFPEWQARRIMRQLSSAVRYMHSCGMVHRDLKPENIVFVHSGEDSPVKIVDFGFARMKNNCEPLRTPCCTLPYAAPEIVAKQGYDESCDMWSLGTILYFMLCPNDPPFRTDLPDMANRIKTGEINFDSEAWSHVSPAAIQVMKGLLRIEPNHRLTARDLKYHPWIVATNDALLPPATPIHGDVAVNHGDYVTGSTSAASNTTEQREGFRLRAVDAAKLAQRRKNKRSTSSSSSRPSSSSSSPLSSNNQQLRPPSATASTANHTSTSSPSVFDYGDEIVNEYLSSLSSSSDNSNSPLTHSLLQKRAIEHAKHNLEPSGRSKKRRHRDVDSENSNSSSSGPMTRSRKRKLEQMVSTSGGDVGSDVSVESYEITSPTEIAQDETSVHRKHKTSKRPKRLPTITVE